MQWRHRIGAGAGACRSERAHLTVNICINGCQAAYDLMIVTIALGPAAIGVIVTQGGRGWF